MAMTRVFVDGDAGTTGLLINERLAKRQDIKLLKIPTDLRKDKKTRAKFLNDADVAFLCLPDDAAKQAVRLVKNKNTIIIDASTAHRTKMGWTYGLPELSPVQREKISWSKRITNPGCHATGFITLLYPLVEMNDGDGGVIPRDYPIACTSVTGYTGGGKSLVAKYTGQDETVNYELTSPQLYALDLKHKHLPEMQKMTGLEHAPSFLPIVGKFARGMTVSIPLSSRLLNGQPTAKDIHDMLSEYYFGEDFIHVMPFGGHGCLNDGKLGAKRCNGTNSLEIFVFGNKSKIMLTATFDNLGKGASGAAIQNMNIALGLRDSKGLKR